jgi:hypothetical protein
MGKMPKHVKQSVLDIIMGTLDGDQNSIQNLKFKQNMLEVSMFCKLKICCCCYGEALDKVEQEEQLNKIHKSKKTMSIDATTMAQSSHHEVSLGLK